MDIQESIFFKSRRTFGQMWIFILGFGIFVPIGIFIYIISKDPASLVMIGFGLIPTAALILKVLFPGIVYRFDPGGLSLKKGLSGRLIEYAEISSVFALSEEEAVDILNRYQSPVIDSERSLALKSWFKSNIVYRNFIRFCSVPVIQTKVTAGNSLNIIAAGTRTSGRFIIIRLTTGEEFLLSPENCEEFYERFSDSTKSADVSPFFSREIPDYSLTSGTAGKRRRTLFMVNIGIFLVLLVIVFAVWVMPAIK